MRSPLNTIHRLLISPWVSAALAIIMVVAAVSEFRDAEVYGAEHGAILFGILLLAQALRETLSSMETFGDLRRQRVGAGSWFGKVAATPAFHAAVALAVLGGGIADAAFGVVSTGDEFWRLGLIAMGLGSLIEAIGSLEQRLESDDDSEAAAGPWRRFWRAELAWASRPWLQFTTAIVVGILTIADLIYGAGGSRTSGAIGLWALLRVIRVIPALFADVAIAVDARERMDT